MASEVNLDSFSRDLRDALFPLIPTEGDDDTLAFLAGIGEMFQEVEDFARDKRVVEARVRRPGWALLLDADVAPRKALPWLSQFVGVNLRDVPGPAAQREKIKSQTGFYRTHVRSLVHAVQRTLTGRKTVLVRERDDGSGTDQPWHLTVITFTDQTPDPAASEAAALSQKDAGIVLHFLVEDGQDWQRLINDRADWSEVIAHFATWDDAVRYHPI